MIYLIFKKEMRAFYRNPLGHIITGVFLLIVGWMFLHQLDYFVTTVQKVPAHLRSQFDFTNEVIIKLFSNINFIFLFIIPILSMRFISDEYKERTIDLYFSSEVSDFQIILGKYLAAVCQGGYLILLTLVYPFLLGDIQLNDSSFFISGYVGLLLNMATFMALGILASSLSKHQMISALAGFCLVLSCWVVGWFAQLSSNYFATLILNHLSLNFHFTNFLRGQISSSDIIFYLSVIFLALFLSKKRLESRMWG